MGDETKFWILAYPVPTPLRRSKPWYIFNSQHSPGMVCSVALECKTRKMLLLWWNSVGYYKKSQREVWEKINQTVAKFCNKNTVQIFCTFIPLVLKTFQYFLQVRVMGSKFTCFIKNAWSWATHLENADHMKGAYWQTPQQPTHCSIGNNIHCFITVSIIVV